MTKGVVTLLALLGTLWIGPFTADSAEKPLPPDDSAPPVTLEADLSNSNSTLLSIPLDLEKQDVGRLLEKAGLSPLGIHGWNAQAQTYASLRTLRPGEGFLLAKGPGKLSVQGKQIVANSVEVPLQKGWNLIGVPYEGGVSLAALRIVLEGKSKTYLPAAEAKWVGEVHTLVNGKTLPVPAGDGTRLEAWRGYWLYAYQPCQLQIPSPWSLEKPAGKGKATPKR